MRLVINPHGVNTPEHSGLLEVQGPRRVIAHQRMSAKDTAEVNTVLASLYVPAGRFTRARDIKSRHAIYAFLIAIGMWKPEKLDNSVM